ncbi:MAG: hypothetical protein JO151_20835 [Verrucomicrobia bacterium]|nr:hypothetical protein [Verrucomicrobiota bacterium]
MYHEKNVTKHERQRIEGLLQENGVEIFHGIGSFVDAHTVEVVSPSGERLNLKGDKILVATGSSPIRPPEFRFHDERVCDFNQILLGSRLTKLCSLATAQGKRTHQTNYPQ